MDEKELNAILDKREEKRAEEHQKIAADQADAFEVGLRICMKKAGITDEEDQQVFMGIAQEMAAAQD